MGHRNISIANDSTRNLRRILSMRVTKRLYGWTKSCTFSSTCSFRRANGVGSPWRARLIAVCKLLIQTFLCIYILYEYKFLWGPIFSYIFNTKKTCLRLACMLNNKTRHNDKLYIITENVEELWGLISMQVQNVLLSKCAYTLYSIIWLVSYRSNVKDAA